MWQIRMRFDFLSVCMYLQTLPLVSDSSPVFAVILMGCLPSANDFLPYSPHNLSQREVADAL